MAAQRTEVLLVEDSAADAELIELQLQRLSAADVVLTRASLLAEAIAHLETSWPDVVLLDLTLPDTVGLQGLESILERFEDLPVVVLTGLDDEAVAVDAMRAGAQDYLVKGNFQPGALVRSLHYAKERKHVQKLQKQLYQADRLVAIGQLASGVAHEINNPSAFLVANIDLIEKHVHRLRDSVTQIQSLTETLPDDLRGAFEETLEDLAMPTLAKDALEMLQESRVGMDRIRSVTRSLSTFAQIERDEISLGDVNDMVESACNMVFSEIRHRARLEKVLNPLPRIACDQGKLMQVVTNLLMNAAQAIDHGASDANKIQICTEHRGDEIVISVVDTGRGIPEEDQVRVFEPFFTTKERGVGTGLGLALVAETVRQHGGAVSLKSELGKGSDIAISLPTENGLQVTETKITTPTRQRRDVRPASVLIVDDEKFVCNAFRRILAPPHNVKTAEGGAAALEVLEKQNDFELIICDLMMPGIDGPQLFQVIEEKYPELVDRVVFCSGGAVSDPARQFVGEVTNILLEKPVNPDLLKGIVEQMTRTTSPT